MNDYSISKIVGNSFSFNQLQEEVSEVVRYTVDTNCNVARIQNCNLVNVGIKCGHIQGLVYSLFGFSLSFLFQIFTFYTSYVDIIGTASIKGTKRVW